MIFGQIQGDYINFTMAAVAAKLNFSWVSNKNVTFICPKEDATVCQILLKQKCDGIRTDGRNTDGGHSYSPPFCSANGGGQ